MVPSQTSQLLFSYDKSSLEKNATQFFHKEVDKKILNQTLQKLFGWGEERHGLQSPLPY